MCVYVGRGEGKEGRRGREGLPKWNWEGEGIKASKHAESINKAPERLPLL